MSISPRVFISFSSKDLFFVRKLFYRLKSQNVNVWDYSQRENEIPWGKDIPQYLKQQIDASDFFIAVISGNSMDSSIGHYAQIEIAHAIKNNWHKQGRILPLVLLNNPPIKWCEKFEILQNIMNFEINFSDARQFEETIAKVCKFLNISYVSPFLAHARLPFSDRFQAEIKKWGLSVSHYEELMLIIDSFSRQYAADDFLAAEKTITYFLLVCQYRTPTFQPYYALIVKGVCGLHLGKFFEAEQSFLEAEQHPSCDENVYGGLGQIYFRQRRFEEAFQAFEKALKICPPDCNLEILFNKLGAEIELGKDIKNIAFLDSFDLSKMTKEEWVNFHNLKGIAHYKKGDLKSASMIFNDMRQKECYNAVTSIYHYLVLNDQGYVEKSIDLLQDEAAKLNDFTLYHYLAHALWQSNRDEQTIMIYEHKLLIMKPNLRQIWIEYARMTRLNNLSKMKAACNRVLDRQYFSLPRTKEDFFYDGFANYLIGEYQRASYDFERSKTFCHYYYDQILESEEFNYN